MESLSIQQCLEERAVGWKSFETYDFWQFCLFFRVGEIVLELTLQSMTVESLVSFFWNLPKEEIKAKLSYCVISYCIIRVWCACMSVGLGDIHRDWDNLWELVLSPLPCEPWGVTLLSRGLMTRAFYPPSHLVSPHYFFLVFIYTWCTIYTSGC